MQPDQKLDIMFCLHMHQPEYRNLLTNQYQPPWFYLHTIKNYNNMFSLLENNQSAKSIAQFDQLFRLNIKNLYHFLKHRPSDYLSQPFSYSSNENNLPPLMTLY